MKRYYLLGLLTLLLPTLLIAAEAQREYAFSDFLRVSKPEGQRTAVSYDTAIAKFVNDDGVVVHLIGVIHIGDKEYYEELNEIFKRYDAVLYELVAEEGARPERGAASSRENQSILSAFQSGMGNALGLDFQLDHIDYHASNMIHADLSPEEFARRAAERGDLMQMFYRAILQSARGGQEARNNELRLQGRLLGSLFASDPSLSLRRLLAEEMTNQLDDAGWIIGGEGSAIITDRNNAALDVLRREMQSGKRKIAIFYGAAHLPEFAKSLERDFQMRKTGIEWIIAWDLTRDRTARARE